ncbi:hypothetical protein CDD80_4949 [Ophiocordyceps camponoti-rufipedis]|uniref:Secreted protein n=1 Tax=Ophiocordyceps camponoti-rufipedis TaxID=2004952 RepID=A0A2C5ZHV3_9HYPO|nr:hypothetical protein CDD80_4949 [Ophiocordyceps camponoti-rufipedis]
MLSSLLFLPWLCPHGKKGAECSSSKTSVGGEANPRRVHQVKSTKSFPTRGSPLPLTATESLSAAIHCKGALPSLKPAGCVACSTISTYVLPDDSSTSPWSAWNVECHLSANSRAERAAAFDILDHRP